MGIVTLYKNGLLEVWPDVLRPHMDDRAAPDLGPVAKGEAEPMYVDPQQFFARTHLTDAMEGLIEDVAATLSGKGGNSIFLLLSFFGGGKTHTMVALHHAFSNPACLPEKLAVRVSEADKPIIVIMDGNRREFMPTPSQPHVEGGFTIRTAWGMLAYRLGAYALVRDLDSGDAECPDVSRLEEVLRQAKAPVLILVDEAVIHLHNLMNSPGLKGYAERFKVFLDRLARAVSSCRRVVLVVAIQAEVRPSESGLELLTEDIYKESASAVYGTLSRLSSRVITPVPPGDVVKVLQKQIFKVIPEDEASRAKERLYYVYRSHRELFGAESDWELRMTAKTATPKETYPFHPRYVEVLYEFVSRSKHMQKTRDAVKITRKVVRRLLQRGEGDPDYIMPWHIRLDSPEMLNKVVGSEFSQFIAVVQRDITSQDGRLGLVSECSKPELALNLATAIFLKTFTYETHKIPLKTFPDLKEAALLIYEPSTFANRGWQPADIETALEEMSAYLRHFNSVDGRYWFDPYKSIIEYVERRADELFHGPRQQLYAKIAGQVRAILTKKERGVIEEHVFKESRIYIDYFSGPKVSIPDDNSLKLVIMLRPGIRDSELEDVILRLDSGAKRTFRNTVAVLMPYEDRFDDLLRFAARLEATKEAYAEIKNLYSDEEVRKMQQDRLKNYEQRMENRLNELLLSTLRAVAYPASENGSDLVKRVETSEANSLIAQAEVALRDTRTGPKLRENFSFTELHDFLKRTVGRDLVNGQSAVELRNILEVFYTNPAAPFTTRHAVEDAIRDGVSTLDIAIKAGGLLYWKEVGSANCKPLPQRVSDDAEILPYRIAAREFRDRLLKECGTKVFQDRLEIRYYEVECAGRTIRLEDLDAYPGWEEILKTGVIYPREKTVPRGFLIRTSPSSLAVKHGEAPVVRIEVQPAGGYDLEVRLEVSAGEVQPESAKPPFTAEWRLPPLDREGAFSFTVRGLGSDGATGGETLTVEVKGAEETVMVKNLDLGYIGAKLSELTVEDLLSARLALEKATAIGLRGSVNLQCAIGDSVALTFADADIAIASLLVPKIASAVLAVQGLKTDARGKVKLSPPMQLDERTITALGALSGRATFSLLVKRR